MERYTVVHRAANKAPAHSFAVIDTSAEEAVCFCDDEWQAGRIAKALNALEEAGE